MKEHEKPIVHDDRHVLVKVDPARSSISLHWKGYAPSASYRATLEHARELVVQHHIQFWLADLRNMGAILRNDELWTVTEWFPKLASSGLRRMAIITSTDYFNQMSVDRIMDGSEPVIGFEVAYFDDAAAAGEWLHGKQGAMV